MSKRNLMILSDNPLGPSGLGRIGRELAENMARMPEIRLGYAALGGITSRHLPYDLYPFPRITPDHAPIDLPQIWQDFAGDEEGILLTIWNHTWLSWLLNPPTPELEALLKKLKIWAYVPVDSTRADGTLPNAEILARCDRLLAYTAFGAQAIGKTINQVPATLPHGLKREIFHPLDRNECRKSFGIDPNPFIVGIVATNHGRKNWGLGVEVVSLLRQRGLNAILWAHTDQKVADWNIPELCQIHKVPNILTDCHYFDSRMAEMYGCCDVTLGIGHGGWELPLSESLACGVPVVTMDWAGQTEFVPRLFRISPVEFHQFGPYSFRRPIFDPTDWADKAQTCERSSESLLDPTFYWENCWPKWEIWIKEGL